METWSPASGTYNYTHTHTRTHTYTHTHTHTANAGDVRDAPSVPGLGRSPGGGMAIHSSILAWRIPWTEEPGGL